MRQSFALKFPRSVMVRLCVPCRIAAAYSSGSVKARTELDATLPSFLTIAFGLSGPPSGRQPARSGPSREPKGILSKFYDNGATGESRKMAHQSRARRLARVAEPPP